MDHTISTAPGIDILQGAVPDDTPAILCADRCVTYGELALRAGQLAEALNGCTGRIVAVAVLDPADRLAAALAVMRAGGYPLPLHPRWAAEENALLERLGRPPLIADAAGQAAFISSDAIMGLADEGLLLPDRPALCQDGRYSPRGGVVIRPFPGGPAGAPAAGLFLATAPAVQRHIEYAARTFGMRPGVVAATEPDRQYHDLLEWALPALYAGAALAFPGAAELPALASGEEGLLMLSGDGLDTWLSSTSAGPARAGWRRLIISDSDKLDQRRLRDWRDRYPAITPVLYTFRPSRLPLSVAQASLSAAHGADGHVALTAPFGKTSLTILDKHRRRTLINVRGELLADAECLRQRIDADPGAPAPSPTGYNARFTARGEIELLNAHRRERSLGERIVETDTVEETLLLYPGVTRCRVLPATLDGKTVLAAFVEPTVESPLHAAGLRRHLGELLPHAWLPDYFCFTGTIPAENEPVTDLAAYRPEAGVAAPVNATETALLEIWQGLLKLENIGVEDNFFELGGHSLLATQLIARVFQQFGKMIAMRDVFDYPTVAGQATLIGQRQNAGFLPIPRIESQETYPTSNAQKRLWIVTQLESDLAAYNTFIAFRLRGRLALPAFEHAVDAVVRRHEILRTTFIETDGEPRQRVHPPAAFPPVLEIVDLTDPETVVADMERRAAAPFDLEAGPLFRIVLYRLPGEVSYLFLSIHHIISDGWSNNLLVKEIVTNYYAFAGSEASPYPELDIQYKDYTAWQLERLETEAFHEHRQFWFDTFADLPPALQLPAFKPRPAVQTYRGRVHRHLFPKPVLDALHGLSREANASLFMTLTAVLNVLFYKYSGQKDIVVGTATSGRSHPMLEDQIGFYLNTLALRNQLDPDQPFAAFLRRVRENILAAFDHQDYPFDRLINELDFDRDVSRHPLFDVLVILQNFGEDEEGLMKAYFRDLDVDLVTLDGQTSMFDLDFEFREGADGLLLLLNYNTDVFETHQIERLCDHFAVLVDQLAANATTPVGRLSVLTAAEKKQLTYTFNDTRRSLPLDRTYHHYLEQYAAETPDKTALVCNDRRLSYAELNGSVNQLARCLQRRTPIGTDDLVAVFMNRSDRMAQAILAVWKCGGAYIPIERRFPDNRIVSILEDAGVKYVIAERAMITDAAFEQALLRHCPVYYIDELLLNSRSEPTANLDREIDPHSLSFVIFTSGSTGKPKGAMNEHIGMMNHALATADYLDLDADTVLVQNASHSFDISVWQFFTAFLRGGTTVVYDDEMVASPERLLRALDTDRVTVLQVVPSYLSMLLDLIDKDPGAYTFHLRHLVCCGEAVNPVLVRRWLATYAGARIVNDYGPAEASDGTSWYLFDDLPAGVTSIPIGRSIYNMSTYVVDEYMNLCPVGVTGELCVAGIGVGRGYLNDDARTRLVFLPDPFAPGKQQKLYKTGDLGRYLPDGLLEFHGRKDYQVKINGQRIELGEIEVKLCQIPGVKNAAVIDLSEPSGRKYLFGFVVFHAGEEQPVADVRRLLSGELPPYMIPRTLRVLDELPITPNGKTDRKALVRLATGAPEETAEHLPPASPLEEELAHAWAAVLKRDRIGVTDNFYDAGGDSIGAIQVAAHLYKAGFKVEIKDILRRPTIRELAAFVRPLGRAPSQEAVTGPAPLTPIQADFFALGKANPHQYNMSVLLKAAGRLDEDNLRTAIQKLTDVHDMLRANFERRDGEIVQIIRAPGAPAPLTCHDLRQDADPDARRNALAESLDTGIRLDEGLPLRAAMFRMPDADYLFLTVHHLVIDGVSWRILLDDLGRLYSRLAAGETADLPPKTDSFRLWAESLQTYAGSERFHQEHACWRQLEQAALRPIPSDFPGAGPARVGNVRQAAFTLSEGRTSQLLTLAHQAFNTSVDELLLTAFGLATRDTFGAQDLVVMLESHGRTSTGNDLTVERTVGWFTCEYPVRLDVSAGRGLDEQIKTIKEALRQTPGEGIGYGLWRQTAGDTPRQRAQIVFNYLGQFDEGAPDGPFTLLDQTIGRPEDPGNECDYPLEVIGIVRAGKLTLSLNYPGDQFRESTVARWMDALRTALEDVIEYCLGREGRVFTPSDFDYKDLSIGELDELESLFQ